MGLNDFRNHWNVGFDMHRMVLAIVDQLLDALTKIAVLKVGDVEVNDLSGFAFRDKHVNFLITNSRYTSNHCAKDVLFALLIHQRV